MGSFVDRPERQCAGKIPYRAKAKAREVAGYSCVLGGKAYHAYKCHWCKQYHVGTAKRKKRENIT